MHITLFGGSFDPPHLGHLLVIQQVFELIPNINQLWLLPAYQHTFQKNLTPAKHRLKMCQLLTDEITPTFSPPYNKGELEGVNQIHLCPLEIDYQTTGETYQTLQLLHSETDYLQSTMTHPHLTRSINSTKRSGHPKSTKRDVSSLETEEPLSFTFIMGSDQLNSFEKWGHWQQLLKEMHFYIYPRANHQQPIPKKYSHNMTLLDSDTQAITNLSSTLIKTRIKKSLPLTHLVPSSIADYINQHQLYPSP